MNKHLIVPGIAILLICVGLSGCTQVDDITNSDEIEILDYTVTTHWRESESIQWHSELGFYHDLPENAVIPSYEIKGTLKNIAGRKLDTIKIIGVFYDGNNNELGKSETSIFYLPNTYTDDFVITYSWTQGYFDKVENVKFEISVFG